MKISVCIISYNEEKKIENCLKSVKDIADEIVIVDSYSTDNTIEIAKKYTDKIYSQKFLGHIEQKNFAVSKSENDWILSLDCDEILSGDLQKNILKIKPFLNNYDAYKFPRKTFYSYDWLNYCWYPDIKIRLFNKNKAKWGGQNPHDRVELSTNKIQLIKSDILHYSFDSINSHLDTIKKFTDISAEEIYKKNKKITPLSAISHSMWSFIRSYFIKKGFMDGFLGLNVCLLSAAYTFIKYSKVIEKNQKNN